MKSFFTIIAYNHKAEYFIAQHRDNVIEIDIALSKNKFSGFSIIILMFKEDLTTLYLTFNSHDFATTYASNSTFFLAW